MGIGSTVGALGFALFAGMLASAAQAVAPLTEQERIGRQIYREGVGTSKVPIQALVGPQGTPVAASTLPCANCHGEDGLGRPEGAVKPSNITWRELTKPYGHQHDHGREHKAFTEQSFAEVLTYGKDPNGNKLDPTMPRYVMSNDDLAALVAYIKRIEDDLDPGVSPQTLRIGTLLPARGRFADLGQTVGALMRAYVEAVNAKGGLFGRKIEIVAGEYVDDPAAALANAERLMREQNVFALVNPFSMGIEMELARLAEQTRVPIVGPFTLSPDTAPEVNRYTFFLLPGLREQGRVLAEFAAMELKLADPPAAILYADTQGYPELAEAVEAQLGTRGWKRVRRFAYPPGKLDAVKVVADMQQSGVQAIFFFGSDAELAELGKQVRDAIWSPYLLAPGSKVARAAVGLPTTFGNRVFLAYPSSPRDLNQKGAAAMVDLQTKRALGNKHQPAQVAAFASLTVLEEGLKRAGRDLSRTKLVDNLENLFSFESGVTPSISYGPNRRVGSLGGYVVRVDLTGHSFQPVGNYIRLD
jgi:ABC-type branched-subunit amino acid transport system substrate-binding protein